MANTPDNFSEKVLAKLKEKNMAVDLTDEPIDNQQVEAKSEPVQTLSDQGFTAFGAAGTAPTSGGNKDILIIPGYGGTTASAPSQINFYWTASTTSIATDNTDASGAIRRATLFNYSDDANNPVLVFGGYNGTLNLAPAGTYGGVTTNTVAKIWIHPFTGTIDTDYLNFGTNTVSASTSAGVLSWVGSATNRLSVGDGANAKQIAYTTDVTSANQITASANNTDSTLYPLFISDVGDGSTNRIVYTGDATYSPVLNGTNGNLTIAGDLAVNGLDITTGSGTASVFNANATTLNMGQAATTISMGASTGTFTVGNTTVTFTNATSFTGTASPITFFGASTSVTAFAAATTLSLGSTAGTVTIANPTVTTGTSNLTLFNTNASTVAAFGAATALTMGATTGTGTIRNATIDFPNATTISGSSALATVFSTANPASLAVFGAATTATIFGAAATLSLGSTAGTVTIANPTVTTGTSNLTLFNTNASTVNAFGAATALTMGATTGTGTIRNATIDFPNATTISGSSALATVFSTANPASLAVFGAATTATIFGAATTLSLGSTTGTVTIANPTVTTGTSSLTLFNTNASTVAAFGAATSLTMGATTGTGTIRNATIDFPNATTISGSSALATVFSTANPSSLAVFGAATTATIFGSGTALTMGATTGTTIIRNTTVTFTNATNFTGTSGTVVFLAEPSTATAFGGATALTLGATTGTSTIRNTTVTFTNATNFTGTTGTIAFLAEPTTVTAFAGATTSTMFGTTASSTINFGAGALGSGNTKTINIGTGGVATSTTAITIGNTSNTTNSTISFAGNRIQNVGEPTQAQDAATKNYVDAIQQGLDLHESVRATSGLAAIGTSVLYFQTQTPSSTGGSTASGSYIESVNNEVLSTTYFDSQSLIVGHRVLVSAGASTTTYNINGVTTTPTGGTNVINGIYTVTSVGSVSTKWRLTRATDIDDNLEYEGGTFTFVQTGALYADSAWVCTTDSHTTRFAIGADALLWTQFSGAGQINAGAGLTKDGNTIDAVGTADRISVSANAIDIASTYVGQTSITTVGTISSGTWSAGTIALNKGGTGTTAYGSNNGLIYFDNGNTRLSTLTTGANTTVLIGAGAGSLPTYGQVNLTTMVTGTLPLGNGGLGTTTFTQNGVLYGNLGTSILVTAAGTSGQLFLGVTSGAPQWGTMSGDAAIGNTGVITINNSAVTYAKIQNSVGGNTVLGRTGGTGGVFAEIAATSDGNILRLSGSNLGFGSINLASSNAVGSSILPLGNGGTATSSFATTNGFVYYDGSKLVTSGAATSGQLLLSGTTGTVAAWTTVTGDVTINGTGTTAIGTNKVSDAMIRQSAGLSVIGRSANSTGNVADITASTVDTVLRYSGSTIGFGAINLSSTNAVTGTLPVGAGGTGTSSYNFGGVVYAGSTAATGLLSVAPAAANKHLVSTGTGTGNYPVWSTATMATTYTAGTILYASSTDTVGGLATSASSALVSNGSGTPSWTAGTVANRVLRTDGTAITFAQVALGTDVSGTLPAGNGGTGSNSSFTANALVYASSTAALATGATLTWIPGTTSGTGSTAALYVNPTSLNSGTAVNINVPTGATGKIIVGQLNNVDKFSVDANGNLRATTKSFDIEHPTKPGMRLVYGVLEGPEHGVYHRGTVEGKGKLVVELPEYWHKLVGENYTIQLTPWGNYAVHIVEKTENYFIIELSSNVIMKKFKSIKVDYIIHGSRLDAPLEIEQ
jgi:hypothetical protein